MTDSNNSTDAGHVTRLLANGDKMPVLFIGHGSPMNALEDNEFVHGWKELSRMIPEPACVLCISAHWETRGTFVTAMSHPTTIHDFAGFPSQLYEIQYPAPGSPELAEEIKNAIRSTPVELDFKWVLDHGTWSILKHIYPEADIQVIQLSLDYTRNAAHHYALAKELDFLRKKRVLIIGSGNMVHNLRSIDWRQEEGGFDWAIRANNKIKELIDTDDYQALTDYPSLGSDIRLAVPTPEHFLPLLYSLSLKEEHDTHAFFNEKIILGSISMTCLIMG